MLGCPEGRPESVAVSSYRLLKDKKLIDMLQTVALLHDQAWPSSTSLIRAPVSSMPTTEERSRFCFSTTPIAISLSRKATVSRSWFSRGSTRQKSRLLRSWRRVYEVQVVSGALVSVRKRKPEISYLENDDQCFDLPSHSRSEALSYEWLILCKDLSQGHVTSCISSGAQPPVFGA